MMGPTFLQGDYSKSKAFGNQSRLVYGTSGIGGVWGTVQESESIDALLYALHHGISVFDTAPSYSNSELYVGKALRQWKGSRPFVSSKIGRLKGESAFDMKLDYSYEGMKRSIHSTLDTLGVEYLDLLFLHEPHKVPLNEIERILDNLKEFKAFGLTKRLGVGGNPTPEFIQYISKDNFDVVSGYLRMDACNLDAFNGEIQQYKKEGIAYYAASALHFSLLGNRFDKYIKDGMDGEWITEEDLNNAIQIKALADSLNMPLPSLAQRYLFSIAEADRIVMGARNTEQIKATVSDWESGKLPEEIFDKITAVIMKTK
ncbi:MAG: aldo/keto reductase [Chitinophagaceae bacterium]